MRSEGMRSEEKLPSLSPQSSSPNSSSRLRPGRWLLGRGWWALPALLADGTSVPWLFGGRWYTDEPYSQAISTRMARTGEWWTPMQGDLPYFIKLPLDFSAHAAAVKLFGDADWAADGPEALWF